MRHLPLSSFLASSRHYLFLVFPHPSFIHLPLFLSIPSFVLSSPTIQFDPTLLFLIPSISSTSTCSLLHHPTLFIQPYSLFYSHLIILPQILINIQVLRGINVTTGSSRAFGRAFCTCVARIFNITSTGVHISAVKPSSTRRYLSSSDSLSSGNALKIVCNTFYPWL